MEKETEGLRGVKGHNRTKIMKTERQWGTLLRDVGQRRREPT